jgi:hypothetical protein
MANQRHLRLELAQVFPHHVRLPPREGGWGRTLDQMYAWCNEHIGQDGWRTPSGFFFRREEDATAFREAWRQHLGDHPVEEQPWPRARRRNRGR